MSCGCRRMPAGLSPRVRGNPPVKRTPLPIIGSIPARAGEPQNQCPQAWQGTVYPRACGGTAVVPSVAKTVSGLSPRVRGNRNCGRRFNSGRRSIPARAGEPDETGTLPISKRVYPRACGGTGDSWLPDAGEQGLSPRVRGNLRNIWRVHAQTRSIPARAGEPAAAKNCSFSMAVYPRACGGTRTKAKRERLSGGLSPRVRGNHDGRIKRMGVHRSIPARAGEPHRVLRKSWQS